MEKNCAVCSLPCILKCVRCMQVHYCSKDHQKSDWKNHKAVCFPVEIVQVVDTDVDTSGRGRGGFQGPKMVLMTTRDVAKGEIILKEHPLLFGPRVQDEYLYPSAHVTPSKFPICLECCRVIRGRGNYACTRCRWPLCGPACENGKTHSGFECKIFATHGVSPIEECDVIHYISISILRALLLKTVAPKFWEQLLEMESRQKERHDRDGSFSMVFHSTVNFIREECGQTQFDLETMDFVAGALQCNRASNEECESLNQRYGSYVYHKSSFATHSCVPNSMWFIKGNQDLHLRASVPIKAGRRVTASTVELGEGTVTRAAKLALYFIHCRCKRCADPTELKTYMSAVKCKNSKCTDGNYLMKNPLEAHTVWKCDNENCGGLADHNEIMRQVNAIKGEYDTIQSEWAADTRRREVKLHVEHLKREEKFIKKHSGKTIHKNHAILFRCKLEMGHRIAQVSLHIEQEVLRMEIEEKQVGWVKECLNLADVFWPGFSRYRGQLLYTLQRGMFCLIFTEVENLAKSRRGAEYNMPRVLKLRQAFNEVLEIRKEVKVILEIEIEGKVEHDYAMEMDIEGEDFEMVRRILVMPRYN